MGLLQSLRIGNRLEYTVRDPSRLLALVGSRPHWSPVWTSIASVITAILDSLAQTEDMPESVASVESVTLVRSLTDDLAIWGVQAPQLVMVDEPAHQRFHRWSLNLLSAVAAGEPEVLAARQRLQQPSQIGYS